MVMNARVKTPQSSELWPFPAASLSAALGLGGWETIEWGWLCLAYAKGLSSVYLGQGQRMGYSLEWSLALADL